MDVIKHGVSEIIPEEDLVIKLERSIKTATPLNAKLGCDPSRPDLHLGHSVVLRKLRQFQELGHMAILIVGDFTGIIGDPSGKSKTRPSLNLDETRRNGETYFEQATKILSAKKVKMLYNSDWLGKMSFEDVLRLASRYTIARMLERDDFTGRYKQGDAIGIHEFLYPLAQAMDSVRVEADVELGGTDQKFNLLVARDIQREYGQEPQVAVTMPILIGIDGVEKMSKSLENYIGFTDPPKEIYGKTMSIPDALIYDYFLLATDISQQELATIRRQLAKKVVNPRDLKRRLARELVSIYHNPEAAKKAEEEFDKIYVRKETPEDIRKIDRLKSGEILLVDLIVREGMASSKSEARRLIQQGAVSADGRKITSIHQKIRSAKQGKPLVLKVGKHQFAHISENVVLVKSENSGKTH
ncbi:MAG: tyrosine--tRNA ligase [Bacteroidota bacterium]